MQENAVFVVDCMLQKLQASACVRLSLVLQEFAVMPWVPLAAGGGTHQAKDASCRQTLLFAVFCRQLRGRENSKDPVLVFSLVLQAFASLQQIANSYCPLATELSEKHLSIPWQEHCV